MLHSHNRSWCLRTLRFCMRTLTNSGCTNAKVKRNLEHEHEEKLEKLSKVDVKIERDDVTNTDKPVKGVRYYNALKRVDELPAEAPDADIGFWQTERGIKLKDQIFTVTGRVARLFYSKESYDNLYEAALGTEMRRLQKYNKGDEWTLKHHGPEWAMGQIIFQLGGAVKLKYDDRWVEDARCLRTVKRKDFRLEGIDLRKSAINHIGLKYAFGTQHIRYVNVGDAKQFDDQAMACLHPMADSLEFLDVSGTAVTERGLGYLRLFRKLRYLNLSRLKKAKNLEALVPYLLEILPEECCVITNDETPSEMYGHPIPFRHPKNPRKDKPVIEGNKNIGNLIAFDKERGALDLYRHETIHELWMTPVIGRPRTHRLVFQQNLDDTFTFKLVRYIVKANDYKPLL